MFYIELIFNIIKGLGSIERSHINTAAIISMVIDLSSNYKHHIYKYIYIYSKWLLNSKKMFIKLLKQYIL